MKEIINIKPNDLLTDKKILVSFLVEFSCDELQVLAENCLIMLAEKGGIELLNKRELENYLNIATRCIRNDIYNKMRRNKKFRK